MKTLIVFILCSIVHQGTSQDLPEVSNNVASYLTQQYCTHGEVLGCSTDCKGRQFCLYGQEQTIDCYTQTGRSYCNPKTLDCTSLSNTCDIEDNPKFLCPGVGYYPHALNCSKLWFCGPSPPAAILECGGSLRFNPLSKQCTSTTPCYTFSPINGLCKGKEGAIVVHPLNKATYAFCSGDFPQIGECAVDHTLNTNKLKCEYECKTVGRFVDPADPGCFHSCTRPLVALISEHICCPANQIFNPDIKTCSPKIL